MEHYSALIAMSGGVDSSVAAHLTMEEGLRCGGATMRLLPAFDTSDAQNVAARLGIPFYVLDMQEDFRREVMDHFTTCYEAGLTPNPCVICNRRMKFGAFLDKALELGYDCVVTGHYARIHFDSRTGRYLLRKAADESKDQTYFLYGLDQEQLRRSRFPLGALSKADARKIAQEQGFLNARKKDSQDICFVPDGDYVAFLEQYTGKTYAPGDYLDLNGKVVGRHKGAVAYTLGQRKGLGLAMGAPVYVCHKDMTANTVTVGQEEVLFRKELLADDWNWLAFSQPGQPIRAKAKARSRMTEQWATIYPGESGTARVVFDEPQRAITPGQAVVLYDNDLVIGGGTIRQVL